MKLLLSLVALTIAWLALELLFAPTGHEDRNGFHTTYE